ncbi:MAG: hypothetical protein QME81_08075 [bacterium]|nr:hypothetical protein [bacterium]
MPRILLLSLSIILLSTSTAYAVRPSPGITDREIIEALAAIQGDIKEIRGDIKRVEQRIDRVEQRVESVEQKIERLADHLGQRIDNLIAVMIGGFGVLFTAMLILVGFILWDRRTTLAPVVREMKEKESEIAEVKRRESELERKESLLEELLRGYAKEEPRMTMLMKAKGLV